MDSSEIEPEIMESSSSESNCSTVAENEYVVEYIMGKRIRYGHVEYCIKWENYPEDECTWEPEANLSCSELLDEYEKLHADCDDLLAWYPRPVKVMKKIQTEYWVKWADGLQSFVSASAAKHGPMKDLIAKFEAAQAKKRPKTSAKRSMDSNDVNDNAEPPQKMPKSQFNENSHQFSEVERIHDMERVEKNDSYSVICLVEFKDSNQYEWIDADIVKRDYPTKLCEFYEESITWE